MLPLYIPQKPVIRYALKIFQKKFEVDLKMWFEFFWAMGVRCSEAVFFLIVVPFGVICSGRVVGG